MATTTTLNSSAAISQYWKKIALDKLEAETHLYKMSWKNEVPSGNGKIINWVRFPLASADTTPAVEGSPVAPETLSSTNFNATMQQYVAAVSFSDVLQEETFVEGGMEEQAATFIAQKLKYTIDALCRAEINSTTVTAGSNLLAPLSVAGGAISSIVAGSTLTASDVRRLRARLANANVPAFKMEKYVLIIHTAVEYDLRSESGAGSYLDLNKYTESGVKDIKAGLVGDIFGVSIYSSSLMPSGPDGSAGVTVYYSYAFGEQSLAVAELGKGRMNIIRKKGGDPGNTYDLANQIGGAVAYNTIFAAKNLSEGTTVSTSRIIRQGSSSALV